ncbi:MAG: DUF255 domain-containing protein [Gemmataceae bacterium]
MFAPHPFGPRRGPDLRTAPATGAFGRLLCLLVLLASARTGLADEVKWRSDYGRALKEATERGVPLFLDVGTENCYWCKQLDARTFTDPELIQLLNTRLVPLKVDGNKQTFLVQALRVQSYPTLVFAGPDGSILGVKEGFVEAGELKEQLVKVLASVGTPDWMQRDFDAAGKAVAASDFGKAISLLRNVVEDGKTRPLQQRARAILAELDSQANKRAAKAKSLADAGKTAEAVTELEQVARLYAGSAAAQKASQTITELTARTARLTEDRKRQAADLLRQARDDYRERRFLVCLDRCEELSTRFPELPEGVAAGKLGSEIKDNPEWTRQAADELTDRLCVLYLSLADSWLKKGQPQQAVFYLERIVKLFPGTRHADLAQVKLARLHGTPMGVMDRK